MQSQPAVHSPALNRNTNPAPFHLLSYPHILEHILDLSDRATLHAFILACKTTCGTAAPRLYKRVAYLPTRNNPIDGTPLTASIVIAGESIKHALAPATEYPHLAAGTNGGGEYSRRRTLHDMCRTEELSLVQAAEVIEVHQHKANQCDATPDGLLSRSRHSPRVKSLEGVKVYFDSAYGVQGGCSDPFSCSALLALELVKPHFIQVHRPAEPSAAGMMAVTPARTSSMSPMVTRSTWSSAPGRSSRVASEFDSAHHTLVYHSGADGPLFHETGPKPPSSGALSLTIVFLPENSTGCFVPFTQTTSCSHPVASCSDPIDDAQWFDHLIFNVCRLARLLPVDCRLTIAGAEYVTTGETDRSAPVSATMASLLGVDEGNEETSPWAIAPSVLMRAVYRELHLLPGSGEVVDMRLEEFVARHGQLWDPSAPRRSYAT